MPPRATTTLTAVLLPPSPTSFKDEDEKPSAEQRLPQRLKSASNKVKKTVRTNTFINRLYLVETVDEYSDIEWCNSFYTSREYQETRHDIHLTCQRMLDSQDGCNQDYSDNKICFRGLEYKASMGVAQLERRISRLSAATAMFAEQERQRQREQQGEGADERLRDAYRDYTQEPAKRAHLLALRDEQDAIKYYLQKKDCCHDDDSSVLSLTEVEAKQEEAIDEDKGSNIPYSTCGSGCEDDLDEWPARDSLRLRTVPNQAAATIIMLQNRTTSKVDGTTTPPTRLLSSSPASMSTVTASATAPMRVA